MRFTMLGALVAALALTACTGGTGQRSAPGRGGSTPGPVDHGKGLAGIPPAVRRPGEIADSVGFTLAVAPGTHDVTIDVAPGPPAQQ